MRIGVNFLYLILIHYIHLIVKFDPRLSKFGGRWFDIKCLSKALAEVRVHLGADLDHALLDIRACLHHALCHSGNEVCAILFLEDLHPQSTRLLEINISGILISLFLCKSFDGELLSGIFRVSNWAA